MSHHLLGVKRCQAGYVPTFEGWQSGEDALLARGVRRFGKQHLKIQQYFLPTRTGADIIARIKHLTRPAAPPNPVKVCSAAEILLRKLSDCSSANGALRASLECFCSHDT